MPSAQRAVHFVLMAGHLFILMLGVFAASTSVLFIKASQIDPAWLSGYRLLLAAFLLSPLFARHLRSYGMGSGGLWLRSLWPAAALAAHFILWVMGARLTNSAHATLIVNMAPVAMPFALILLARERVTRPEIAGTVIALLGLLFLATADVRIDPQLFRGDLTCFVSMLFYTLYLALGRRNRDLPSLWLYVVPTYTLAGLFCTGWGLLELLFAGKALPSPAAWQLADIVAILGLAFVPTIVGHSCINFALRHLRGQIVVLLNLSQFIFAAVLAWLILADVPQPAFYPAALLTAAGAVIVIRFSPREHRPAGSQAAESSAH